MLGFLLQSKQEVFAFWLSVFLPKFPSEPMVILAVRTGGIQVPTHRLK